MRRRRKEEEEEEEEDWNLPLLSVLHATCQRALVTAPTIYRT
jgi:hypothetical protein